MEENNIPKEKVKLSGQNAFDIFLDIICDFNFIFVKQNYLNMGDYNYFFTTEKISNKQEVLDTLKRKSSLETAYLTLGSIKDMRLSIYFAIKDNVLTYGYFNEDNSYIYKVGKFKINTKILKLLSRKKCLKTIRSILDNSNLKNLSLLQIIKVDFHTLFDNVKSDVEIIDENRIKNTFDLSIFKDEDRNENKLRIYLTQWSRNFKWSNKCYYIIHLTEKYAHFYIKIIPSIQD